MAKRGNPTEDLIADEEENLSWVKSKIKRCAREGIKEGEGLKMFKSIHLQLQRRIQDFGQRGAIISRVALTFFLPPPGAFSPKS